MNCYECDGAGWVLLDEVVSFSADGDYREEPLQLSIQTEFLRGSYKDIWEARKYWTCPYCDGTGVEDGH